MEIVQIWLSGAEATRSAHGSPFGAGTTESASADFHELRQGFSPHRPEGAFKRLMEGLISLKS
jgi:hypothetical protein